MRRDYSKAERLERASLRVAVHIRELWEETGKSHSRLLDGLFLPDQLVLAGHSHAFSGTGRREHVVPLRVVINECKRLIEKEHASDQAVAAFIRNHVKIVMISHEECERLDRRDPSKQSKSLKQRMPDDWEIGHDIFARLEAVGIAWTPSIETQPGPASPK